MEKATEAAPARKRVFLGGTCNNSTWREELIPLLVTVDYFNPVVADWTPECQAREIQERETTDWVLYVITPKMLGPYSVAEAVDDSNKRPARTIFCVLQLDGGYQFPPPIKQSLAMVGKMIAKNGGTWLEDLKAVAQYLNLSATFGLPK